MRDRRTDAPNVTERALNPDAVALLDRLIAAWTWQGAAETYYFTTLIPAIVDSPDSAGLTSTERTILDQLKRVLTRDEMLNLAELIADRRREVADKRARHEREEVERGEAARRAQARREEEERQRQVVEREERARRATEEKERRGARRRERESLRERRRVALERIREAFDTDFLGADEVLKSELHEAQISRLAYDYLRREFVRAWAKRELGIQLDHEQARAIAATGRDVHVVARAGAGKTRTLVTRAVFLQEHCKVAPREILLLAFNKKAAQEMRARLSDALDGVLPHVMTFHALAYALVHPEQRLVFDDVGTGQLGLSEVVQDLIDEHLRTDALRTKIQALMLAHFRDDWERIVAGRFELVMDEFLAYRRMLPRESLKGDFVKSFGERVIANALFENGVDYRYERNFRWSGVNYRPDFTIRLGKDAGVVIEYFGMAGDPDYDEMSSAKRTFWSQKEGWTLLEFAPHDLTSIGVDAFVQRLVSSVEALGVPTRRLPEEEIWELVKRRAVDCFTGAMKNFVGRCRQRNLAPDGLAALVEEHVAASESEGRFLEIGASIYRDFLDRLATRGIEDFDGLMWRASALVRGGQTRFARARGQEQGDVAQLRFVHIDEFQDFSEMFFRLLDAVRAAQPEFECFCVGDDWQAINAFAGSELRFFAEFSSYFPNSVTRYIRTNYRSATAVVEAGNAVMTGRGPTAKAARTERGRVSVGGLDKFKPLPLEKERHGGDEITPAILRLVRHMLDRDLDVVLLSRRRTAIPWYVYYSDSVRNVPDAMERFLANIRSFLPEDDRERVIISTAHGYKGLERPAVVLLDAVARSYPLIHPTWVFLRIFGDSIEKILDDERRLFYVAMTRAEQELALVTEARNESPFLIGLGDAAPLDDLRWATMRPVPSLDGARLEIRVFNAFEVRDALKDQGYQFDGEGRFWRRTVLEEGFSIESFRAQRWMNGRVKVEVLGEDGELRHRA